MLFWFGEGRRKEGRKEEVDVEVGRGESKGREKEEEAKQRCNERVSNLNHVFWIKVE